MSVIAKKHTLPSHKYGDNPFSRELDAYEAKFSNQACNSIELGEYANDEEMLYHSAQLLRLQVACDRDTTAQTIVPKRDDHSRYMLHSEYNGDFLVLEAAAQDNRKNLFARVVAPSKAYGISIKIFNLQFRIEVDEIVYVAGVQGNSKKWHFTFDVGDEESKRAAELGMSFVSQCGAALAQRHGHVNYEEVSEPIARIQMLDATNNSNYYINESVMIVNGFADDGENAYIEIEQHSKRRQDGTAAPRLQLKGFLARQDIIQGLMAKKAT